MKTRLLPPFLGVLLFLGIFGFVYRGEISETAHSLLGHRVGHHDHSGGSVEYWTCPMHPSVRSDEPGACPMCGMDLTPVHRDEPADHGAHEAGVDYWTCPMHPSVRSDEPDGCPICGMDLTQVRREAAAPARARTEFVVDTYRRQLVNVQSTPVEERTLEKEIRTVGILELDETRITDVYPRVSGWIQDVYVNFLHQPVEKGQPLFSVYSPELVASQEEYLLALRTAEELGKSSFEHVSRGAGSLLQAARRRLELFDVNADRIRELEKEGRVETTLVVHSPVGGYVTERNAFPNRRVTPESRIYTIADYSRIWAWIQIYEHEIGQVRVGQPVVMRTAAYPAEEFRGRVTFITPRVEGATRTVRARLEFPNPDFRLKPEMYVDVELKIGLGRFLAVPDHAVLRTGRRDQVFVDHGEGRMELRPVSVGEKAGGYYRVLSGLHPGERVVTNANFLIDSESKIRGIEADWDTPQPTHAH